MLQLDYLKQAILLFERVKEMAPEEPQSYLDLGLVHFMNFRRKRETEKKQKNNFEELTKAIELVATVLRKVSHKNALLLPSLVAHFETSSPSHTPLSP